MIGPNRRYRAAIAAATLLFALTGALTGVGAGGRPAFALDRTDDRETAPRPVSDAERAAVELVALYLDQDAGTWTERLAPECPWSTLAAEEAQREIEARMGPPKGSAWTLQTPASESPDGLAIFTVVFPSGAEDTVALRLARDPGASPTAGDAWRVASLRSLADPSPNERPFADRAPAAGAAAEADARRGAWQGLTPSVLSALVALWALATLLAGSAFPTRPRHVRRLAGATLAATAAGALLLASACRSREQPPKAPPPERELAAAVEAASGQLRLGALRDVRWALATDGDPLAIEEEVARVAPEGLLHQVADLWRAQLLLRQVDLRHAEAILSSLPDPGTVPLAELLRARLATTRGDDAEASYRFDRARALGPDHDGLRLEAAAALATLGFDSQSEAEAVQIAEMGSRIAEVWYIRAQIALLGSQPKEGEEFLRTAWAERPVPRADLFDDPVLATLTARATLFPLIEPSSPEEPTVEPRDLSRRAVRLPTDARTSVLGRLLRIEIGDSGEGTVIEVPGGSALAPRTTTLTDAGEWSRREEEAALSRLDAVAEQAASLASFGQPRLRRQILEAAAALARKNRWEELVLLTDGIGDQVARVPAVLVQLRAQALRQTSRGADARQLLIRLARISMESKRPAPGVLYQLAELFVSDQEYDVALRLIRKASSLSPLARNEGRIAQIGLERWLYDAPKRHWSNHFEVVYPTLTGDKYARQLATVLEAERERIGRWVPLEAGYPIEVDLFPLERFMRAYSGGVSILGLYDGRVRVPFADLRSLHPRLVSVVSHEVAHALIGQATFDQAPNWFHEGLAQHVEMLPGRVNPIPDLAREGRVIAFPLIEPILDGFAEPQLVDLAYGEAAWVVHYLEAVHGVKSIRGFIQAFREGLTTEEAIDRVLGMSLEELDRAVWSWCIHRAPASWPTKLVRYDEEVDQLVKRRHQPKSAEQRRTRTGPMTVAQWHADYSRKVAPFKETLGSILEPLRQEKSVRSITCVNLSSQINRLLKDPTALHPPDAAVEGALQDAFQSFSTMAEACSRGARGTARTSLALAERSLGQAASAMGRYGLRP